MGEGGELGELVLNRWNGPYVRPSVAVAFVIGGFVGFLLFWATFDPSPITRNPYIKQAVDACIEKGGIPILGDTFHDEEAPVRSCQFKY